MNGIGLDCGTATVKLAMLSQERELLWFKSSAHHGAAVQTVRALLGELLQADSNACGYPVMLTGSIGNRLLDVCPGLLTLGDIPAIHRGIHLLAPEAKSVIEIGSQSARFLTALDCGTPPRFAVNEHCAGGTGSFFEDQMSRLGLRIEDYSELVAKARSIPRLSGRCAVFAKTDIIHRQQEGVPTPDILLGLCYAMVRNYKAVIVRGLSVEKPVALCGGVGYNAGVLRAIRDVFGLTEEELILPKNFLYAGAPELRWLLRRQAPVPWENYWPLCVGRIQTRKTGCTVVSHWGLIPRFLYLIRLFPAISHHRAALWALM